MGAYVSFFSRKTAAQHINVSKLCIYFSFRPQSENSKAENQNWHASTSHHFKSLSLWSGSVRLNSLIHSFWKIDVILAVRQDVKCDMPLYHLTLFLQWKELPKDSVKYAHNGVICLKTCFVLAEKRFSLQEACKHWWQWKVSILGSLEH